MSLVHGSAPHPDFGARPSAPAPLVPGSAALPASKVNTPRAKNNSTNNLPKNTVAMKQITKVDGKDGAVSYRVH